MTPKEKSIQLFQKFDSVIIALFVCNEVLNALPNDYQEDIWTYWNEVIKELRLM